jgi:hypothetical protein
MLTSVVVVFEILLAVLGNVFAVLGNTRASSVIGLVLGGVLLLLRVFRAARASSDAKAAGGKREGAREGAREGVRGLLAFCALVLGLVAVEGLLQWLLAKAFPRTNLSGLFTVVYSAIALIFIPLFILSVYSLIGEPLVAPRLAAVAAKARSAAPTPKQRLAIVLVGCAVALIGYRLPWYQVHAFGHPSHLLRHSGADLDANPPYYISLFNLGNYPYSFLFALIAIPLVSVFTLLRGRHSVFVSIFGRSLHAFQVLLLFVSLLLIRQFSVSGTDIARAVGGTDFALAWGLWLAAAGLGIVFVGINWPYADRSTSSKKAAFLLSVVFLVVAIAVVHFGGVNIALSIARALGGGGVAIVIASFVYNLISVGLVSAGIGVLLAGRAASQELALATA